MPRTLPLSERDREIGRRITQARKELMVPRTAMALKLGISTDRLVSYEFGRVKLPWGVGEMLCTIFGINPLWLGTGRGTTWGGIRYVDDRVIGALGPKPLFSQVVDEVIVPFEDESAPSQRVQNAIAAIDKSARPTRSSVPLEPQKPSGPFLSPEQAGVWHELAFGTLRSVLASVPHDRLADFSAGLRETVTEYAKRHARRAK